MHYFKWSIFVTIVGLVASFYLGFWFTGNLQGALTFLFIGSVLAVLEISLSVDNAIVNANKLKTMTPIWRKRFLTWGILIAVFGMRIVFPLTIVSIATGLGPIEAVMLAGREPETYSQIMHDNHLSIAAFGGTFLMMVALSFFIDDNKDVHWLAKLEVGLRKMGGVNGVAYGLAIVLVYLCAIQIPTETRGEFFEAALLGLLIFLLVDMLSHFLDNQKQVKSLASAGGLGAFLYLEVLDASFSFDGVVGAFALTQNLFLIAIGLGIGAMYVRSMTIMLVEKGTLSEFRYLEHGAFYSIFALAIIMLLQSSLHVPEIITGLLGASIIATSFAASVLYNKSNSV
jgi:hypothetical protein